MAREHTAEWTHTAIVERIRADVERLCAAGDRHPGTARNRDATSYVADRMGTIGVDVQSIDLAVPAWDYAAASVRVRGRDIPAHPSPFSGTVAGSGRLVAVSHADELRGLDASGAVLMLHGDIANVQFTPRGYPWYENAEHAGILDTLERLRPLAILTATGKNPAMTAAMSPFPLIEDPRFTVPSAYVPSETGLALLEHRSEEVTVRIDSSVTPSTGTQLIGRVPGREPGRVVIAAHIDTKPETPGALDNAGGVAVLLMVAELLITGEPTHTIEFLPFNGEDHASSPGEVAYLEAYPDLTDIELMVNIDGAGVQGGPSAWSGYALRAPQAALIESCADKHAAVMRGPQWHASDHMIFVSRGIPSLAVTSMDLSVLFERLAHTPEDTPDNVDYSVLARTARFIADVACADLGS